ncbi:MULTISPECIES: PadR family transcriptional regulator [Desulfobacula]|uniref:Poly-beta-hydroxybutyrate-responsive repressor n=2 Tax=Desulfobacula TaxID=28222 RepID=A0A1H2K053_9BACT|nr:MULTISPECIES: helix-turn-helix transcriptional regulator [Desulfobacula]CCK78183.1 putative transcriptional regulator related to PadR [Desulfobacula toluolica Tol2]SDU61776.1 poly-beta-hydroxybutyrate-responsive repressor [Desulfobacula phenolica]
MRDEKSLKPGSGRQERYIQASILLGLSLKPSYGYELISTIQSYGFIQGDAPPGMVYRHLRQMEEDNLLQSEWETKQAGAAKRIYTITQEGKEVLSYWIKFMVKKAQQLNDFVQMYHDAQQK